MLVGLLAAVVIWSEGAPTSVQEYDLSVLRSSTVVRVFSPSNVHEGRWVGLRATDAVIQREGLRRTIAVSAINSVQQFIVPHDVERGGMLGGAILVGGAFGLFYHGVCDESCFKGTATATVIGVLVGGAIGRAIGGAISSAQGQWVTRYRRGQ